MPKKSKRNRSTARQQYSVEELLEAAEAAASPEQSISIYRLAIQQLPKNDIRRVDCLEHIGEAHVSLGHQDEACRVFQEALLVLQDCQGVAERKASLHLYIGQLSCGHDALQHYQQGIQAFQESIQERKNSNESTKETEAQLAKAYCSVAELYLTDLCYDDNAERECEAHVQEAIKTPTIDVYQTVASLRLSQQRNVQAVDAILQVYEQMKSGCEALATLVGLKEEQEQGAARELVMLDEVQELPGFEFRCQTAKLLLECANFLQQNNNKSDDDSSRANQCGQAAVYVLGSLLAENDEVVEIWQLTGDALVILNQQPRATHYYEQSILMLSSIQQSLNQEILENNDQDETLQRQLDEVLCQLEEVKGKLAEIKQDSDEEAMEE